MDSTTPIEFFGRARVYTSDGGVTLDCLDSNNVHDEARYNAGLYPAEAYKLGHALVQAAFEADAHPDNAHLAADRRCPVPPVSDSDTAEERLVHHLFARGWTGTHVETLAQDIVQTILGDDEALTNINHRWAAARDHVLVPATAWAQRQEEHAATVADDACNRRRLINELNTEQVRRRAAEAHLRGAHRLLDIERDDADWIAEVLPGGRFRRFLLFLGLGRASEPFVRLVQRAYDRDDAA